MMKAAARMFFRAIKSESLDVVRDGLEDIRDLNIHDDATGESPLSLSLSSGENNLALLELLLQPQSRGTGITDKCADIFFTNRDFRTLYQKMNTDGLIIQNKKAVLKRLLNSREFIDMAQLEDYLNVCKQYYLFTGPESESNRHSVIAHYASRLCGKHVGQLLRDNHNIDRYIVHIRQYSFAERDRISLESWHDYEFLSLRIYSYLEILVKLELNSFDISLEKKREYVSNLKSELLDEVETLRTIEEHECIQFCDLPEAEKSELHRDLAEQFVKRLQSRGHGSFSGGFKGHSICVSFSIDASGSKYVRFDNLGFGIDHHDGSYRHTRTFEGKIQSVKKRVKTEIGLDGLIKYVKSLVQYKYQPITGSHNPNPYEYLPPNYNDMTKDEWDQAWIDATGNAQRLKEVWYSEAYGMVEKIYDDQSEFLDLVGVDEYDPAQPEQQAGTCVVTSQQVGLLNRYGEDFYVWIVAEETKCLVNDVRNKAALNADESTYWNLKSILSVSEQSHFTDCMLSNQNEFSTLLYDALEKCTSGATARILMFKLASENFDLDNPIKELGLPEYQNNRGVIEFIVHVLVATEYLLRARELKNPMKKFDYYGKACSEYENLTLDNSSDADGSYQFDKGYQYLINKQVEYNLILDCLKGICYSYIGDRKRALICFESCARIDSRYHINIAFLYLQEGNVASAEEQLRLTDEYIEKRYALAEIAYRKSRDTDISPEEQEAYAKDCSEKCLVLSRNDIQKLIRERSPNLLKYVSTLLENQKKIERPNKRKNREADSDAEAVSVVTPPSKQQRRNDGSKGPMSGGYDPSLFPATSRTEPSITEDKVIPPFLTAAKSRSLSH